MTKQHFTFIASEFRKTLEGIATEGGSHEAKELATKEVIILADNLAQGFKQINHAFDYDRFTAACGFHGTDTVDYRG